MGVIGGEGLNIYEVDPKKVYKIRQIFYGELFGRVDEKTGKGYIKCGSKRAEIIRNIGYQMKLCS